MSIVKNPSSQWAQFRKAWQQGVLATGMPTLLPGASLTSGAVSATGVLTSDNTNVANAATVTIGAQVYTFKTTLTASTTAYEVLIGASADASLTNLRSAVNLTGTPGTDYGSLTPANLKGTFGAVAAHAITFTALAGGTTYNAVATTETSAHLSWGAATLTGGTGTTDAIPLSGGLFVITATSIDAITLGTPVAVTNDGAVLQIMTSTAFAHTVTTAANKIVDGSGTPGDTLTFAAQIGANCIIKAYNGLWYVQALKNVTLSEV